MNTKDNIKENIVNVAGKIFARFGFKKTTVDEIAGAVNKAKSSIYHYFKSKEEIYLMVLEKERGILNGEISKAINYENNPQKKLQAYVITKNRVLMRLVNFYDALKDEYLHKHYGFIKRIRERYFKDEIETIKEILRGGIDQGVFINSDIEGTAIAITTAIKGLDSIPKNDATGTERHINRLLEVLYRGIVRK